MAKTKILGEKTKWVEEHDIAKRALVILKTQGNLRLVGETGCHRRGQKILLYDGTVRPVEDLVVGDLLMGPDSAPRHILSLARGTGRMYAIRPLKGDPFIVNEDHILTLVRTNSTRTEDPTRPAEIGLGGKIVDISVKEWLAWSKGQKHLYKLFRVPVTFPQAGPLPIDPYFLGVLLGDGSIINHVEVTTADKEIATEAHWQAWSHGLWVTKYRARGCSSYRLVGPRTGKRGYTNGLIVKLRELGLFGTNSGTKFVPRRYMVASRTERLALLAGLMDTDGYCGGKGYEYSSKSERLANDIAFVARSLGFLVTVAPSEKRDQNGHGGTYWRLNIWGGVSAIPCRVPRKRAAERMMNKDVLRTGFSVELSSESDEYFGFSLDGDGRYLLGDFLVTHNTGKSTLVRYLSEETKSKLYEYSVTSDTSRWDLLAAPTLKAGSSEVEPRVILHWLRDTKDPGVPKDLFIDEFNLAAPGVMGLFMSLADFRREVYVPELGMSLKRTPMHRIILAMNPHERSGYSGTIMSNIAQMRRFPAIRVPFLSIPAETDFLTEMAEKKGIRLDYKLARRFVEWADKTRTEYKAGGLSAPVTTGQLLEVVEFIEGGLTVEEAIASVADGFMEDETAKLGRFWDSSLKG